LRQVERQKPENYKAAIKALRDDPAKGFGLLDRMGAVTESKPFDRPEAVAAAYRAASGTTLCVCPTHEEIEHVTAAIRDDRTRHGELRDSRMLERFAPLHWTAAQKRDMASFVPGQVLVFHRGTKHVRKHESLTVIRQDDQTLIARNDQGKEIALTGKQSKCFGVFVRREIEVAVGDRLAIQANGRDGAARFTNGELVTVTNVGARGDIQLADGRTLPHTLRQFNHGYAITAHKAQGATVDHVIVSGDAMTRELFYVSASRGRQSIQVFTGAKESLIEAIGVSGQRQSALELLRKSGRTVDRTRFAERPRTLGQRLGSIIETAWLNIPRLILGPRFAPERDRVLEISR
jgi:hypothetical protein